MDNFTHSELEEMAKLFRTQPNDDALEQHLKAQLAAGFPIYYGDPRYPEPDYVVEERPDGKRFLMKCSKESNWQNVIVKELEERNA